MLRSVLSAAGAGLALTLFAALPSTANYTLNSYGFGSGGTAGSSTSNYALEGISGELSGQEASTATYGAKPGFVETQQANVPKVTLSNPSSYYDKLLFVLDAQNNPTDALYALQVKVNDATCNFSTGTILYAKSDHTLGATLTTADYQTYSSWGGSSGTTVVGLSSNTTYCMRAKATQGKYTESAYGPSSSAATVGQQLSFCLYSNANCAAGGTSEAFGGLTGSTITSSPTNLGVDFATNADAGGSVYIYSANGGLHSTHASYTLPTVSPGSPVNLGSINEGYGAQIISASQGSGGPLSKASPYNGSANLVGSIGTTANTILTSTSPITLGQASIQLQVKPSNTTPEATDYADTVTLIAAAAF